jgi:hypothetical protein
MNFGRKKPRLPAEYDGLIAGEELLGLIRHRHYQTGDPSFSDRIPDNPFMVWSNADEGTWYTPVVFQTGRGGVREAFNKQILLLFDSGDHVPHSCYSNNP